MLRGVFELEADAEVLALAVSELLIGDDATTVDGVTGVTGVTEVTAAPNVEAGFAAAIWELGVKAINGDGNVLLSEDIFEDTATETGVVTETATVPVGALVSASNNEGGVVDVIWESG